MLISHTQRLGMRRKTAWVATHPTLLGACVLVMGTGCTVPPPSANAPDADPGAPGLAPASNPTAGSLIDWAEVISFEFGGAVDLNNLKAGDRIVFDIPQLAGEMLAAQSTPCECTWTVEPTPAGAFEELAGCRTVFVAGTAGNALITLRQVCGKTIISPPPLPIRVFGSVPVVAGTPMANAGPDQSVDEGDEVLLNGLGSVDPEGDALTFAWSQISGFGVVLSDAETAFARFIAPDVDSFATLTFALLVSDGEFSDSDQIVVTVFDEVAPAGLLLADAGPNQVVDEGTFVTLDGSGSAGSGISPLSFEWQETTDQGVFLITADEVSASFVAPQVGPEGLTLVFALTVVEGEESNSSQTTVTVVDVPEDDGDGDGDGDDGGGDGDDPPPGNIPPVVADASVATAVNQPVVVTLTGSDANSDTLSFSLEAGLCDGTAGAVVNVSPNSATVTFTPEFGFRGTARFGFFASDGSATSNIAVATIVVGGHHPMRSVWSSSGVELLEPDGVVDRLLEDGVTTFMAKLHSLRAPLGQSTTTRVDAWSQRMDQAGTSLWLVFNWFAASEAFWLQPLAEPYVDQGGVTRPFVPCTTWSDFWNITVRERVLGLIALTDPDHPDYIPSLEDVWEGVLIDVELYASQDVNAYESPCYCDRCFQEFLDAQGLSDPLPPAAQRYAFLLARNLVTAYENAEREAVRGLASAARQAIRAAAPCLKLAGTALVRDFPFYEGFALGWGTSRQPLYELTQRQLDSGYNGAVSTFIQSTANKGIFAELVVGLTMESIPPDAYADHYYTSAVLTGGVWVNRSDYYDDLESFLCFDLADYRAEISAANVQLDLFEANPFAPSPYNGDPFPPACIDTTEFVVAEALVPLEDGQATTTPLEVRKQSIYYFHALAGETPLFEVALKEIGSDQGAGWWALMSPSGEIFASGAITEASSPQTATATTTETGIHGLIFKPSVLHVITIPSASHPGSYLRVDGTPQLNVYRGHLVQPPPQLYVFVPPGEAEVGVTLAASLNEQTRVKIFREEDFPNNPLFDDVLGDTPGDTVVTTLSIVDNPSGGIGVVLVIELTSVGGGEDLKISFDSGALPYLSQTRSGLFKFE